MQFQRAILPGCALLIVLCFVTLTRADPDLWGHVRFGGDIIDSAAIRLPDTYSFTADKPWTNHEWLAEIIMAAAYRTAGAAGLVLLKLTIVALSLGCMWRIVRADTPGIRPAAILMTLALAGILPRVQQVRPQLFSVLCFALLMTILRRAEKRPAALWFAPPLFAVWANLHGGWLVGCGTLALWCSARTWTLRTEGQASVRSLAILWSACVAAVAATLINPYGPGLWMFLAETVGLSRRFISEWGPVTGSLTTLAVWSFFALLVVVAIKRAGRIPPLHALIVPVFWGIVAFKVSRLDAFFALSTHCVARAGAQSCVQPPARGKTGAVVATDAGRHGRPRRSHARGNRPATEEQSALHRRSRVVDDSRAGGDGICQEPSARRTDGDVLRLGSVRDLAQAG